jgi:hypothetical protein
LPIGSDIERQPLNRDGGTRVRSTERFTTDNAGKAVMRTALLLMTFVQGLGAGICFDVAMVKLPTRHRIGATAYANFARGNDLGNGLKVYPFIVVGGGLSVIALTVVAYIGGQPASILHPLYVGSLACAGYLGATAKAAPIMWSLKTTPNSEPVLKEKLDRFAYWHGWRTAFQLGAFIALLWARA